MSGVEVKVIGDVAVEARMERMPANIHNAMLNVMTKLGLDLEGQVVDVNLGGAVLNRKSGRLAQAQNMKVIDNNQTIIARVGFSRSEVPYGPTHELGTPTGWLIVAKAARALRFNLGGNTVFARSVFHPPMPERSFLRTALTTIAPTVKPEIEAALRGALNDGV